MQTRMIAQAQQKQNWIGLAEHVTACVCTQQLRGHSLFSNLVFWNRFWGHFGPFFSFICSSRQAGFSFNLAHLYALNICSCSLLIWTSHVFTRSKTLAAQNLCSRASDERCSQGWTMLFAQPQQAMKLAATENYATLVWHHRHLACGRQVQPAQACGSQKTLESPKNWSGHGLSNWTGSTGPVATEQYWIFTPYQECIRMGG